MRLFRSFWLITSALYLMVHQLVPHHHEHNTNEEHFCAVEQSETWSRLVGSLSIDLGQHHLESFRTPESVKFDGPTDGLTTGKDNKQDSERSAAALDLLQRFLIHRDNLPSSSLRGKNPIFLPKKAVPSTSAGRAPPVA